MIAVVLCNLDLQRIENWIMEIVLIYNEMHIVKKKVIVCMYNPKVCSI